MSVTNTYTVSDSEAFWPTGTSIVYNDVHWDRPYVSVTDGDIAWQPSTWDEQPKIWKCVYCGAQHWIKDEELQCKKCGAPRDDI